MEAVVGVFTSRSEAEHAIEQLRSAGISNDRISLLTPSASENKLEAMPTTDAEPPGMGGALGGVVGGALGAASGMSLGVAAASLLVPGVGPVMAIGVLGAALLGAGGAVGGAMVGKELDESLAEGLPKDELFIYEDALRKGRTLVMVFADDDVQMAAAHRIFEQTGAESVDAAREDWWLGLRDAEAEYYGAEGQDFKIDEPNYRSGFAAALHPQTRGKAYAEAGNYFTTRYPQTFSQESFRRGYERGQAYYQGLTSKDKQATSKKA
jgi:hypothetical protein